MKSIIFIVMLVMFIGIHPANSQSIIGNNIDTTGNPIARDLIAINNVKLEAIIRQIFREEFTRFIDRLLYSQTTDTLRFKRVFNQHKKMEKP